MILLLNTLDLPEEISKSKYINRETNKGIDHIGNIDRINIFVGANNSGKSRFMRGLLKKKSFTITNNLSFINYLEELFILLDKLSENKRIKYNGFIFSIYNENIETNDFINEAHERLFKSKFIQKIELNSQYFLTFKQDLQTILLQEDEKGKAEELLKHLRLNRDILDISYMIYDLYHRYERHPHNTANSKYTIVSQNNRALTYIEDDVITLMQLLNGLLEFGVYKYEPSQRVYIPILRSARTLLDEISEQSNVNTKRISKLFENTIISSYGFQNFKEENIIIATGLDLYESVKRARNERKAIRKRFEEFEDFIQLTFFNNKEFEIVAREADSHNEEHINISIDGEEHDIHNLGDGIQSIIILLYPIFMAEPKSWIFIEEPELHLHPGLQRIFIESLLTNEFIKEKELTIFFTTHSNHLLNFSLTLNKGISIFTFQKIRSAEESTYNIKTVKSHDISILNLLEVNNSSVFLANCSIWVEGITDRIYLRSYLQAYQTANPDKPTIHEDLHFAFFEYAGSNVSHYLFEEKDEIEEDDLSDNHLQNIQAQFLANRILLIADSDAGKERKHTLLGEQQSENFKYICLPVREVENLLSPELLKQVLPELSKKFKQSIVEVKLLIHTEYMDQYLGTYLESQFGAENIPKRLKAESGTLSTYYKNKLAEKTSNKISWNNMSEAAKEIAISVYDYILSQNPQIIR